MRWIAFWRWRWSIEGKVIGGLMLFLVLLLAWSDHIDNAKCDRLMGMARTSRDTLDAAMACEQIHAATSRSIAIGFAAGAVAGSRR